MAETTVGIPRWKGCVVMALEYKLSAPSISVLMNEQPKQVKAETIYLYKVGEGVHTEIHQSVHRIYQT